MRFVVRAGAGDELGVTALVREYHNRYPQERIRVDTPRKNEVFRHNPYIDRGTEERHPETVLLNPLQMDHDFIGNMVISYGVQAKVEVHDVTPEVWLTEAELEEGARLVPHGNRTVAIDTWAMWPSRRWPLESFVRLASLLRASGWKVVEIGRMQADDFGHLPTVRIPSDVCLFDRTTLRQAASVLAACDLYVGNDSGMFHLAAAVGTPQVAFFGIKPWWARAYPNTLPVFHTGKCYPQCGTECALVEHPCMTKITVERAFAAVGRASALFRKQRPRIVG